MFVIVAVTAVNMQHYPIYIIYKYHYNVINVFYVVNSLVQS